jgi:hypothetical protein
MTIEAQLMHHLPATTNGSPIFHSPPKLGLGWTLLFLLALPFSIQAATGEAASRNELEILRQEIEALRLEVEQLRAATTPSSHDAIAPLAMADEPPDQASAAQLPGSVATWNRSLSFTSPDDRFSLSLGGRLQPRYEYERREGASNLSSFSMRRIRLDFRGHAHSPDLTYRIMPELARTASMRDGYVNYRKNEGLELRFGQFSVPFSWEREVSSNRHQFMERSLAHAEFEWKDGRDLGLMLHGEPKENLRYGVGIFGGDGQNVSKSSTDGHLLTARLGASARGEFPESEVLVTPLDEPNLTFGLGIGYANKNAARDWHRWTPDNQTAHLFTTTADAHFQLNRFSSHLMGFYRDVETREGAPAYDGFGATLHVAYLLRPERLSGSLRYSYSEPNRSQRQERARELLAGLQLFQFGHNAKIYFDLGRIQRHDGNQWIDTDTFRTQYQLLF